jgi:protein O-mannosyl-transferase
MPVNTAILRRLEAMFAKSLLSARWSRGALVLALFCATLALTAAAYWPSLRGVFIFDDFPNIVENPQDHPATLSWQALTEAALSSPVQALPRPLAMLSFALDWYWNPGDAHQMRLVNLCIHLLNGMLLFGLLRRLIRVARERFGRASLDTLDADLMALCITAAWLLAPINFTAVAYVVQRMESLCQVFVFAGLWAYVVARQRMLAHDKSPLLAGLAIAMGTGLGVLAKESAALLPLYAFILEWTLFNFARSDGKTDRRIVALYALVLALPGALATTLAMHRYMPAAAWSGRSFNLWQRLLTEPRIIVQYLDWSVLPMPNALGLYHDNIEVSQGLLSPVTTIASIVLLLGMLSFALYVRKAIPLAAVGILWFLAAHLLTGTIIPLELAFEHRNYFASLGLYLALVSIIGHRWNSGYRVARMTACVALIALFATVTLIRSMDWGNPLMFSRSEAEKNPNSPRTQYELGRTYVIYSRYQPDSQFVPLAYTVLNTAATMQGANALPDQALLVLSSNLHRAPPEGVWPRLQQKLEDQPLSTENISAMYSLNRCVLSERCDFPPAQMVACFLAALHHTPKNIAVLTMYADFASNILRDMELAIRLTQETVDQSPGDLQLRLNMLLLLQMNARLDQALEYYQKTKAEVPGASNDRVFQEWGKLLEGQQAGSASD